MPMFAYWKGRILAGTVIDEMVTTLDLTATTLKAGGGTIPSEFDGVDLLPRLTGRVGKIVRQEPMFWGSGRLKQCVLENGNYGAPGRRSYYSILQRPIRVDQPN